MWNCLIRSGNRKRSRIIFSAFADTYALTEREQEVLKMLLASDEEVQEIANRLYISRAMFYRLYFSTQQKTDTNSRIGLIQFYYTWKPEKRLIVTTETYVNSRIVQFYVKLFQYIPGMEIGGLNET